MNCPICQHPGATVSTISLPPDSETGYRDESTILDCPSCGVLYDGEIQTELDSVLVPLVDTQEEVGEYVELT